MIFNSMTYLLKDKKTQNTKTYVHGSFYFVSTIKKNSINYMIIILF